MDAFSIKDKQGNPIFDDGYLSFICEESNNIIRVDTNQFKFSGSEPYPMEHDGVQYNLYLIKNSDEAGNAVDLDELVSDHIKEYGIGTERGSEIGLVTEEKKEVWNKKNTEVLMGLYQEMDGTNCFTYPERNIWEEISEELKSRGFHFSSVEVENRVKAIEMEHKMKLKQVHTLQLGRMPPLLSIENHMEVEEDSKPEPEPPSSLSTKLTEKQVWNKKNTEVLMGLYQEMDPTNCFTYYPERNIWEEISEELKIRGFHFSSEQVENRIKAIEMEHKMKLKQAYTLQLGRINQELRIKKPLKNQVPENVFKASESVVYKKQNATDHSQIIQEPLSDAKPKYIQEDNNCRGKPPPLSIENHMEVEEDSKPEPEPLSSLSTKLTGFKVLCQNRRKSEWNEETTKLLIDLYQKYSPELGKVGKFATKMQLWSKISDDLKSQGYCFNPVQVQTRWRTLSIKQSRTERSKKNSKTPEFCKENGKNIEESHDLSFKKLKDLPARKRGTRYSELHRAEDSKVNLNEDLSKASWSEEQAEMLIDVYKEITQNHNLLKFGSKKHLWKKVAQDLRNRGHYFTPQQVHSKWKSLQRSLKTKLDRLKKIKLQAHLSARDRFNLDHIYPDLKQERIFNQPGEKQFGLPLEMVLKNLSDEESKSLPQSCSVIVPDDVKAISESLNKLSSIKESYYKDRLLLKEKKLKAFEERTVEIRKTNDLLKQFLKK